MDAARQLLRSAGRATLAEAPISRLLRALGVSDGQNLTGAGALLFAGVPLRNGWSFPGWYPGGAHRPVGHPLTPRRY